MTYLLHSRKYGYLSPSGWSVRPEHAIAIPTHAEARSAARAAARKYGVCIDVLKDPAKSSWKTRRDQQTAATLANSRRIDSLLHAMQSFGTLVLSEPHGRIYGYGA